MKKISRRSFIKKATVLGTAASLSPVLIIKKSEAAWQPGTKVHPNIDELRTVGITHKQMVNGHDPKCSWKRQEEMVNKQVVWDNLDRAACALADTRDSKQAWQAIFVKPPFKSWSDTVVAIKTNHISRQHTHSAVMSKICHSLTEFLGINPKHIHIYDACHGRNMRQSTPFSDLPEGCRIENQWGGSSVLTEVNRPWKNPAGRSKCLKYLVDSTVDIVINVAMCKGHSKRFGGFSMTMKNHFGTFSPNPGHQKGGFNYLLAINQTKEILGAMHKKTGKVLYPRQQLCLVDALWASKHGPSGDPSHQTNYMAMGVFSPVLDFQLARHFRGKRMGWHPNKNAIKRFLTDFGYKERDLPFKGEMLEI